MCPPTERLAVVLPLALVLLEYSASSSSELSASTKILAMNRLFGPLGDRVLLLGSLARRCCFLSFVLRQKGYTL